MSFDQIFIENKNIIIIEMNLKTTVQSMQWNNDIVLFNYYIGLKDKKLFSHKVETEKSILETILKMDHWYGTEK